MIHKIFGTERLSINSKNKTSLLHPILMIFLNCWQDLVKYSIQLGENVADLQKALELMLSVPHRAINNKFLESIEGYRGKQKQFYGIRIEQL